MYNLYICIDFIYIMEWLVGNENQGTALKTIPTILLWMSSERVIHHKHHQHHPPPSWLSETRSVKSPIPCVSPVYLTAPPPPPPATGLLFHNAVQCSFLFCIEMHKTAFSNSSSTRVDCTSVPHCTSAAVPHRRQRRPSSVRTVRRPSTMLATTQQHILKHLPAASASLSLLY